MLREFQKMNPPTFKGEPGIDIADSWLRQIKRLMNNMEVPVEYQTWVASNLLLDEAGHWWDTVRERQVDADDLAWGEFERLFRTQYIREAAMSAKMREFIDLKQLEKSVAAYEAQFNELARYAASIIVTEEERARRFIWGLRPTIRTRIVPLGLKSFSIAVERAMEIEQELDDTASVGPRVRIPKP
jgi:hypothetical protein